MEIIKISIWYSPYTLGLAIMFWVFLSASGDAKYHKSQNETLKGKQAQLQKDYHLLKAMSWMLIIITMVMFDFKDDHQKYMTILAIPCFRLALFDPIYNIQRGLDLRYIGNNSYYDQFLRWLPISWRYKQSILPSVRMLVLILGWWLLLYL